MVEAATLIELYVHRRLSTRKCAEALGVTKYVVDCAIAQIGVPKRGRSAAQRGRKFTAEHRQKLSSAHKGKTLSEAHKQALRGRPAWNRGKGDHEFICAACGASVKAKPYRLRRVCSKECRSKLSGEAHWNYKGNESRGEQTRRSWVEYRNWKKAIHTRDCGRCRLCFSLKDIHAHHINSWSEYPADRYKIANGITLCRICHLEFVHQWRLSK